MAGQRAAGVPPADVVGLLMRSRRTGDEFHAWTFLCRQDAGSTLLHRERPARPPHPRWTATGFRSQRVEAENAAVDAGDFRRYHALRAGTPRCCWHGGTSSASSHFAQYYGPGDQGLMELVLPIQPGKSS